MTQEVPEEGQEALEIGDFQEAQEAIMNALGPAHMVKGALTAAQGIIEARDTGRMKKEAALIVVQERMTADTGQDIMEAAPAIIPGGMVQAMEDPVHMDGNNNKKARDHLPEIL